MDNYMSAGEVAEKWGITQRRVAILCKESKILNAIKVSNMWLIPNDAKKPSDGRLKSTNISGLKPFIKWAGGKGQLLNDLNQVYPKGMGTDITKYAEPFIGGGAVLFDILSKFKLAELYISDINSELINIYRTLRDNPNDLLDNLEQLKKHYISLSPKTRNEYFYNKREEFNIFIREACKDNQVGRAALFIFLNRTCFNGLYRVNNQGEFNVPAGAYKNPQIYDKDNLLVISKALANIEIVCGDYKQSDTFIDNKTLVYFDPPYRPLNTTSSFTSYTKGGFDDSEQIKLADYVIKLSQKGAKIIASNSDPKCVNEDDNFFDELYKDFVIKRIKANRRINSKAENRGYISELLITNF